MAPVTIDPLMNFGRHKGEPISQVPSDYLAWIVAHPTLEVMGTRNWKILAKQELERRRLGAAIVQGMPVEELDKAERPKPDTFSLEEEISVEVRAVLDKAIDQASIHLIKEFITRRDRSLGITKWLSNLAEEAYLYGHKDPTSSHNRIYLGQVFRYNARDYKEVAKEGGLTLLTVEPWQTP